MIRTFAQRCLPLLLACGSFLLCGAALAAQTTGSIAGAVSTLAADGSRLYLPGVSITLRCEAAGAGPSSTLTNETGRYSFAAVAPGKCTLTFSAQGFKQEIRQIDVTAGSASQLDVLLTLVSVQSTTVTAAPPVQVETTSTSSAAPQISQAALQTAPLVSERFQDALPLLPGVVRGPDGLIDVKGARAGQAGTLVNSVSGVDPVTGQAAISLPLEAVESVKVLPNPFSAEYGRFAGGVTEVETRSGTDQWKYLFTNFFPRLRRRGGHTVGLESITPRLTVAGPLVHQKLYIFQSFDYRFVRVPVESLPPLQRDQQFETFDSSTQFDWLPSSRHHLSGLVTISPQNLSFMDLNTFNPQPTTPDFRQRGFQVSLNDTWTIGSGVLQSFFSAKRYDVHVFPASGITGQLVLFPEQNSGSWFNRQDRDSRVYEWSQIYRAGDVHTAGTHSLTFGYTYDHAAYDGTLANQAVQVIREDNTLSQLITFAPPSELVAGASNVSFFVQDHWAPLRRVAFDLGLRFDHEGISSQALNVAPRVGFVFAPTKDNKTAIRGGIGLFYDKIPLDVATFFAYPAEIVTQFAADGVTVVSGPTAFVHGGIGPQNLRVPYSVAWNVQADRELRHNLLLRVGYEQRLTHRDYFVEPVLVPLPELDLVNRGAQSYREFQVTLRWQLEERTTLFASYVRSRARGDLNNFGQFFDNFPNPIIRADEFRPLPYDAPNRFLFWGVIGLPWKVDFSPVLDVHNGFPFSRVDNDLNFVGPRDEGGRFPAFASFDVQIVRPFRVKFHHHKPVIRVGLKVFNVTNHFNPRDVQDNIASPNFGDFYNGVGRQFRGKFEFNF
ncbi:MAG TPA: TonB-dependent receptor [Candidatus Acidoferrales bacterium]|nr:TonB-dependent receptor [Candidatus Acidoferrales bacterium]